MDLELKDKVALVTGSSQGIGKAIAFGLAEEGARISICARNEKLLNETAEEIESATKAEVLATRADVSREEDIQRLVTATEQKFGRIDILVNNVGGPPSTTFLETSMKQWRDSVDSLLMSVVSMCSKVVPLMQRQKWGRIINMTSFVAKQPEKRLILSNTLRSGILGLTKTLSNELAEYGILVNAVCPGWTMTKRVENLAKARAEGSGKSIQEIIEEWTSQIPLKRLAKPKEIADLVVFLASERASYITGTTVQVDGGVIKSLT